MTGVIERLRAGNLNVRGRAGDINALLRLHREAADVIERLHKLHEERDAIGRDLSEKVEALIAENDGLRKALGRIADMEKPPSGHAQHVTLMKGIAREALSSSAA